MKKPKNRKVWGASYGNKLGWLAQGIPGRVEGTNDIMFINREDIPTA